MAWSKTEFWEAGLFGRRVGKWILQSVKHTHMNTDKVETWHQSQRMMCSLCFFRDHQDSPFHHLISLSNHSLSSSPSPTCCLQMFLTVYLSNNDQHFTEVPVTPETLCRDVVDLCKEPGEADCHLSEMWRGSGERLCQFTHCCVNPCTQHAEHEILSHTLFCLWNMAVSQGMGVGAQTLVCVLPLIGGKLLFWSSLYMVMSCVVNCLVLFFFFFEGLISLDLQCKWSVAHNPCNKHGHPDISHISSVEGECVISCLPHLPIFKCQEVIRIPTQGVRLYSCFHGDAAIRWNKVPVIVFEYFLKWTRLTRSSHFSAISYCGPRQILLENKAVILHKI